MTSNGPLLRRSRDLLPLERDENLPPVLLGDGVDDVLSQAQTLAEVDLRFGMHIRPAEGQGRDQLQHAACAGAAWTHMGRFRIASTSVAGRRSPVADLSRGFELVESESEAPIFLENPRRG